MTFKGEDTGTCFQRPDLDHVIHRTTDATVARVVKDDAIHLLRVALETLQNFSSRDFPHSNCTVVTTTDERVAVHVLNDGAQLERG